MVMRYVVPATAAAALGLSFASGFAGAATGTQQCAALEAQVDAQLPATNVPSDVREATAERDEGAKLCHSGQTEAGMAKLRQALADATRGHQND
jgi:hypothetical protein